MSLSQDGRVGKFETPLGKDKLTLTRFQATEGLSELFHFEVDALSAEHNIDFNPALGRNCCLGFLTPNGPERLFNGILVEAQWVDMTDERSAYRLTLRPWLWLLSRAADCRIFHNKTPVDIIRDVFDARGFPYRFDTRQSYPTLDYCVQYRETDLDFVLRLMEQYGIYYFFEHSQAKHEMVLVDSPSAHRPAPRIESLDFLPTAGQMRRDRQHISSWAAERRFQTGRYALNDYDYLKPTADLNGEANAGSRYQLGDLEQFDYPGLYTKKNDGEALAKVRLEGMQSEDRRRQVGGNAVGLYPGVIFTLKEHPNRAENQTYLVIHATHQFTAQMYRSGGSTGSHDDYQSRFVLQEHTVPFRPPRKTRKPVIHGAQTAKVVGKKGEEIDVDEHGRILVHFFWDRHNDQSSRVRVAQTWAGPKWGAQMIPRLGMEVLIDFLEGDPDRPLVVGSVYNGDNKVPYELPANKTQSGTKSDSSKGHHGYNELMFEDKKGAEQIRVHAEMDLDTTILHAETRTIGQDFLPPTGMPSRDTTLLKGDDNLTIQSGNRKATIAMNETVTIGVSEDHLVGATRSTGVLGSDFLTIGATQEVFAGAVMSHQAGGNLSLTSGAAFTIMSGAVMTITVGGALSITAPAVNITGALILTAPPIIKPVPS